MATLRESLPWLGATASYVACTKDKQIYRKEIAIAANVSDITGRNRVRDLKAKNLI